MSYPPPPPPPPSALSTLPSSMDPYDRRPPPPPPATGGGAAAAAAAAYYARDHTQIPAAGYERKRLSPVSASRGTFPTPRPKDHYMPRYTPY